MSGVRRFLQSMQFAWRGFAYVWRSEQNFRIQLCAMMVALLLAWVFGVRTWEWMLIVLAGGSVLVLECINSGVERLVDLVQPRLHGYVREIKDIMAAAVLIASVVALAIGIIIFLPHVW